MVTFDKTCDIPNLIGIIVILTYRTWAIYERSRKVGIGLCIWFVLFWVPQFVITGIFLDSVVCKYNSVAKLFRFLYLASAQIRHYHLRFGDALEYLEIR